MANESTKSAKVNGQLSVEEVSEKFNGGRKIRSEEHTSELQSRE